MTWWHKHNQPDERQEMERIIRHAAELHGVSRQEVVETVLDEGDAGREDPPGRRTGVWVTLVIVGVAFGAGVVFMMHLANSSDAAGPDANAGIAAVQKKIAPTPSALPSLTGKHIAFSYSRDFDSVKNSDNLPTTAERYMIGSTSNYRRSISVMVENNTATMDDDSGYKYRSIKPDLYHSENLKVGNEAAVVMVKNDNTERTLYWGHAGKMVIISITSTNAGDNLAGYVAVVAASLRWIG